MEKAVRCALPRSKLLTVASSVKPMGATTSSEHALTTLLEAPVVTETGMDTCCLPIVIE
jgi:hypothetical protein